MFTLLLSNKLLFPVPNFLTGFLVKLSYGLRSGLLLVIPFGLPLLIGGNTTAGIFTYVGSSSLLSNTAKSELYLYSKSVSSSWDLI
jgi:hypothetical protein